MRLRHKGNRTNTYRDLLVLALTLVWSIAGCLRDTGSSSGEGGKVKPVRGGAINQGPDIRCRAAYRLAQGVDITLFETGFRVVCEKQ